MGSCIPGCGHELPCPWHSTTLRDRVRGPALVEEEDNKLARAWARFRDENPKVYAIIRDRALEMLERHRKFGIKMLFEVARWQIRRDWDKDDQGFKLNNNYTAYCARDLIAEYPAMADLIETRETRSD